MSTTYQQQPSANQLKQEKSHSQPPSACHLITLQHLASPIQPILPTRPAVCLPFVISSLLKTKNTSKFSCFIQYNADYSFESEETAGLKRLFFLFFLIIWIKSLELDISRDFDYRQTSGMCWGSEQNYEVTQIKTLLNPQMNITRYFCVLYGWS